MLYLVQNPIEDTISRIQKHQGILHSNGEMKTKKELEVKDLIA